MAEVVGLLRRDALPQLPLYLQRVLAAVGKAKTAGDADAVGVADISLLPVDIPQNEVGGLTPHAGEPQQLLHGVRHSAAERLPQHTGRGYDIPCLGTPEAAGVDVLSHLIHVRLRKGLQRGVAGKKCRGHQIHPCVGTLGRQPHGKQQLIVLAIVQRALCVGIQGLQRRDDGGDLLFGFHLCITSYPLYQTGGKNANRGCKSEKNVV